MGNHKALLHKNGKQIIFIIFQVILDIYMYLLEMKAILEIAIFSAGKI